MIHKLIIEEIKNGFIITHAWDSNNKFVYRTWEEVLAHLKGLKK